MNSNLFLINLYYLINRFRKTQAALYVKDSMHYGLIRSYIDLNQSDKLLQILKLKVFFVNEILFKFKC
jgi:hypothetical protein